MKRHEVSFVNEVFQNSSYLLSHVFTGGVFVY